MKKNLILIMLSLAVFSLWGCGLSVKPTKTTVTYGQTNTTNDTAKDAKTPKTVGTQCLKKTGLEYAAWQ